MSEVIATEVTETEQPTKGRGRPSKIKTGETEVTRETRTPMGGFNGPLDIVKEKKDPNYHYYWELDESEVGSNIERRLRAGYVFCLAAEGLVLGGTSVYKTEDVGSIIRVPAGQGRYHYLMKIPLEWYEEDTKANHARVDATEQALNDTSKKEGYYGELSIKR